MVKMREQLKDMDLSHLQPSDVAKVQATAGMAGNTIPMAES